MQKFFPHVARGVADPLDDFSENESSALTFTVRRCEPKLTLVKDQKHQTWECAVTTPHLQTHDRFTFVLPKAYSECRFHTTCEL